MRRINVTYRKSTIGYARSQKATMVALGLKLLNHSVEHELTDSVRGMIFKVRHLVNVDGVAADSVAGMSVLVTERHSNDEETSS